jgi:ABC-type sugar transport system substrate-binding protein
MMPASRSSAPTPASIPIYLTSYVGSDDTISGYMEAKAILDKIGCKGNVVILEGPIGQSAQIQRLEGNKKALKANALMSRFSKTRRPTGRALKLRR